MINVVVIIVYLTCLFFYNLKCFH
uniref:Uncharacterized protein n=1 Tax=Heterorhabditis bacteriophora TaxID=37862 RepID=A0A1I7WM09_HETBA